MTKSQLIERLKKLPVADNAEIVCYGEDRDGNRTVSHLGVILMVESDQDSPYYNSIIFYTCEE